MMDLLEKAGQISQALMAPVIAAVVAYIAWEQWQTNALKLKLDLYDRRFRVYRRTFEFWGLVIRDFHPTMPELSRFGRETIEADFLFGPEVREYLNECRHRAGKLYVARTEYDHAIKLGAEPGFDLQARLNRMHEEEAWFGDQAATIHSKFRPYLELTGRTSLRVRLTDWAAQTRTRITPLARLARTWLRLVVGTFRGNNRGQAKDVTSKES